MIPVVLKHNEESVSIQVSLHDSVEPGRPLPLELQTALGNFSVYRHLLKFSLRMLWTEIALASVVFLASRSVAGALGSVITLSALRWIVFYALTKRAAQCAFVAAAEHLLDQTRRGLAQVGRGTDDDPPLN